MLQSGKPHTDRVPPPVSTPPPPPRVARAPRRRNVIAAVPSAPHTRPGDQNALCVETDQA
jgi:hypothetical protein